MKPEAQEIPKVIQVQRAQGSRALRNARLLCVRIQSLKCDLVRQQNFRPPRRTKALLQQLDAAEDWTRRRVKVIRKAQRLTEIAFECWVWGIREELLNEGLQLSEAVTSELRVLDRDYLALGGLVLGLGAFSSRRLADGSN